MIRLVVKLLNVGDVEDPEIYLGAVAWDWLQTEHGQWCKQHATDLVYNSSIDYQTYGYKYAISCSFSDEDAVMYRLKWGHLK